MTNSSLTSTNAPGSDVRQLRIDSSVDSRFHARWLAADPARAAQLAELAGLSLSPSLFARLLQKEISAGLALPRAMRRLRNLLLSTLITRDLASAGDLPQVVDTMTAFAEFALQTHVAALSAELQALHGVPTGDDSGLPQALIVLGMGKLGGGELNVSSDIDLIFVYPEDGDTRPTAPQQRTLSNHEFFIRLGRRLIGDLSEITQDGFTFRVDMALRPNGNAGPLVASINMVEEYLLVQGREWERYAWVKARAICGAPADIAALDSVVQPFVYRRYLDFGSIDALRGMHGQIRAEVARVEARHPERSNNVKLGRGGIREIEFLAQVFQLIRGGRDADLRSRSTRGVLESLADKQLLEPEVVTQLLHAYTFLRNLEHRLQYLDDAQTHTLPASEPDQLIVARMMGYADTAGLLAELARQRQCVSTQFDAIFADKECSDGARPAEYPGIHDAMLSDDPLDALEAVLARLDFSEAHEGARRLLSTWQSSRLQALPEISRNRLIALVNVALPLLADCGAMQLITLYRLLDFMETVARRAAYLALLTEYPHALQRVVRMMSTSDWAAKYLTRHPILLDELLDDRTLRAAPDWPAFRLELQRQLAATAGDTERQMDTLREMHHAQTLRLLAQDIEGDLSVEHLADHLSTLADILVDQTVLAVWNTLPQRHCDIPKFAVIAYGKLGGKELGYSSDLDVIFLFEDDDPEAPAQYAKLAQRFITWMTSHTPAGILFDIDIALRPDGASGLLVSTIAAFEKYQLKSAWVWEHQALTRARFCAGDTDIGQRFELLRLDVLRQPREAAPLQQEVRTMRDKMTSAHPARNRQFDLKHDRGGMIDIEFIVQYLVLLHASTSPQLTDDIGNIALLKLASGLGLIDAALAAAVANAYRVYRKLQHHARLQGEEQALVAPERVATEALAVQQLWTSVFGDPASA
ncbi:MAG: glutamate-ammonia-ligase adenylyltransferase [Bradyrhizobium sp.]|jgi:glutamate-ammonia-ligase adenylyltransferase